MTCELFSADSRVGPADPKFQNVPACFSKVYFAPSRNTTDLANRIGTIKHLQIYTRMPASIRTHYSQATYHYMRNELFLSVDPQVGSAGREKLFTRWLRRPDPRDEPYRMGQSAPGGQEVFKISRGRSGLVNQEVFKSRGSGRVGSAQGGFKSHGSGRVGSGGFQNLAGQVGPDP